MYVCTFLQVDVVCMYVYMYACKRLPSIWCCERVLLPDPSVYVCMCVCLYVCIFIQPVFVSACFLQLRLYMCVCVYVCMYVRIYAGSWGSWPEYLFVVIMSVCLSVCMYTKCDMCTRIFLQRHIHKYKHVHSHRKTHKRLWTQTYTLQMHLCKYIHTFIHTYIYTWSEAAISNASLFSLSKFSFRRSTFSRLRLLTPSLWFKSMVKSSTCLHE